MQGGKRLLASARRSISARNYPPYKLSVLTEVMGDHGFAKEAVLRGTGLAPRSVDDPKTRTSIGQYLTACGNAVKLTADPSIPLLVGKRMHLSAYGAYGFALLCSGTARESFNLALKYHALATPTLKISWYETADYFVWTLPADIPVPASTEVKRFLVAQQLAQHYIHGKEIVGPDCAPLRAALASAPAGDGEVFERHFECPVSFGQPRNELFYSRSVLDQIPRMTNRVTAALMRENCESLLEKSDELSDVPGEVFRRMMENPGEFPTMERIASSMGMTPRTLRRRLSANNKSFSDIFDDVRKVLALEYLKATKITVEEVAELLGFADAANFRKSFKRWTGKRPSECRAEDGETEFVEAAQAP